MKAQPRPRRGQIFAMPALIALVTLLGLIVGLVGEGIADFFAWVGVGFGVALIAIALVRR